jgi:hypothetical protein
MFIFMRETYATTILERKAARLRRETGNSTFQSELHSGLTPKALFVQSIVRPARMLMFSPIIFLLSTFNAVAYGYLYLLFTTIPTLFYDKYRFSSSTVGLAYLGIGFGAVSAVGIFGATSDRLMKKSAKGEIKPEYRLPLMVYGAPCIPIGLLWYGWSAEAHTHWIIPVCSISK